MIEYAIYYLPALDSGTGLAATASTIAALLSLIVSIIAWRTSKRQLDANEKHNRIIVRPSLRAINSFNGHTREFTLSISNAGFGPGQIFESGLIYNGEEPHEKEQAMRWLAQKIKKEFRVESYDFSSFSLPHQIMPGEIIRLLHLKFEDGEIKKFMPLFEGNFSLKFRYKSAYDELFCFKGVEHQKPPITPTLNHPTPTRT